MATSTATKLARCAHVTEGPSPLGVDFVLEDYLGLASALTTCGRCGQRYLLELIDIAGAARAYRVAALDAEHADRLIRTLTRGTCDIQRAGQEMQNLQSRSALLGVVLCLTGNEITSVREVATVPTAHWRELPCDGTWLT